ncbi:cell division protein FtsQ/DivIB [Streptomyces purpurogeneiscleroticus]|uniref:cell division protein FtsQ/DivIB n=1 Tax=Streptomyces purpurogeneiscleroticus TaxID=68259 RepID=UPI001CBF1C73|nr:FtsQ-type POTRA domain-containing protein [Streptomyces purpurogeneiscleroticus]MBZ4018001.1 cell division protein FtsQ [Streptomyces purpurogeneiscleroticus]
MAGPSTTARRGEQRRPQAGPPADSEGPEERLRPRWLRLPRPGARLPGRPRRRTLIAATVLIALLVGFGTWVLYGSDWLRAERVAVRGTDVLTVREVEAAADVPLGDPLASLDTDGIAARLADRLRRIKSVEVERSWPDTISLNVTERQPVLVVQKGGKFIEVDDRGVRFATVGIAPRDVPRLEMDAADSPSLRRFGIPALNRAAVKVATALPDTVGKDVRVIRVRSYDSITLELTGGRRVEWGSEEHGKEKAKVLRALLKAARDAHHFDVSVPSAPAAAGS